VIEFAGVHKTYRSVLGRQVRAVEDVSFRVAAGEVVGIAGPNGAGKSTLISLLLGFLTPTAGTVRVDARAPRAYVEAEGIGYLPELMPMPKAWPTEQALHRFAALAGIPAAEAPARVADAIARVGIDEHRAKPIGKLSKGNAQRVGLAQVLLRDERLYVFDEPTHGLDPVWIARFRDLVEALRRPDRAMLVASHNLDELERLCDRVVILDRGRVQRVVALRGAAATARVVPYRVRVADGEEAFRAAIPDATPVAPGEFAVDGLPLVALNGALARAIAHGAVLERVAPAESQLEREFRDAVGAGGPS
jgi:ABC-type multidrug transport system ATPase subunit